MTTAETPPAADARPKRARMVTLRAVLLALVLMPLNALWVVEIEVIRYSGHPTTISLFFNVVFILVVLLCLNGLVRRFRPRWALSPGELLTVYIMLGLSSAVASHDMVEVLTPILAHVHYFATPENGWAKEIIPHVPRWLTVSDPQALDEFYTGTGTLYSLHNLRAWGGPVLLWTGLLSVIGFMMLCINTILRRQWTEHERLAYPLVQLPLEMVDPQTSLFRSRLFWGGVALAASLQMWNGLAYLNPWIPMLPLKRFGPWQDINTYFTARPWSGMGQMAVALYPFGIALGILLPADLLFSTWFFAWFWSLQTVFGSAYGYNEIPGFPYREAQSFGGYMGIAVAALWLSRRHFLKILRGLFRPAVDLDDADEPIRYRWAVAGLAAGSVLIWLFCRMAGMSPLMIFLTFLIYFGLAVAITRMRAELGPPAHDLHNGGPDAILPTIFRSNEMPRADLAMFSLFRGFNRAYRSHPMPVQLEGFKMAERIGGSTRPLFGAMMLAIVFGLLCAFWADLHLSYHVGAAERIAPPNVQTIFGREPWDRMSNWITAPISLQQQSNTRVAIVVGLATTLLLYVLRLRLPWFPFHPVGYAVSSSWSMVHLWLPLMIAWAIKVSLLHYGGLPAYRRALPFFMGIILGECVVGSLWSLIGIAFHIPTYAFWP